MKKRLIIIYSVISFLLGLTVAFHQGKQINKETTFYINNVPYKDRILLSSKGDLYQLTSKNVKQITRNQNLIEPVFADNNIVAVEKTTNYSSLVMYNLAGEKIRNLLNGKSGNIDSMSWFSDPSINPTGNVIAYVSDKDKRQTQVPDNALYVLNISDGKSTNIASPAAFSGGITHPIFNPVNGKILLYDYYQYDPGTSLPYSTIEQYNKDTGLIRTLTFENKNAYQESFSPDGKQLLFLGRNNDIRTVTLYVADFTSDGLKNIFALTSGDLAYPTFSNINNHIYYLQASGNSGYDLFTATIDKSKLKNIHNITSGSQLLGTSSFSVIKL